MFATYTTVFRDAYGEELTSIENDGETLRMVVREIEFSGKWFDDFTPALAENDPKLRSFTIDRYDFKAANLCGCMIECDIPIPVVEQFDPVMANLHVVLDLGLPNERHVLSHETLSCVLDLNGVTYRGSGKSGWFEDEMVEIQASLPPEVFMKACINCAFSDYSVYGHGLFGCMICFRNCKTEYLAVTTKEEYMRMPCPGGIFPVQETYLCSEFERRNPGTGYRG